MLLLLRAAAHTEWTDEEVARALVMQTSAVAAWLEKDRLFLMFSAGFLTFAVSRLLLAVLDEAAEGRVFVYLLRLLAFALILAAIIDKNRSPARGAPAGSSNSARPEPVPAARR